MIRRPGWEWRSGHVGGEEGKQERRPLTSADVIGKCCDSESPLSRTRRNTNSPLIYPSYSICPSSFCPGYAARHPLLAMDSNSPVNAVQILDIHARSAPASGASIRDQIISGLSQPVGRKTLPTLLLYDERGLRMYDEITTDATEYYLFPAEEEILKNKADEIVRVMHSGVANGQPVDEIVVELGAG